jgi:RNA-directed DNA polymerase
MGGKGGMTTTPGSLQDLRKSLYIKAKAEPTWRFWGLYVHVCKEETLREAYAMARKNEGAPGIDGVTFESIEAGGVESFLQQIRDELVTNMYQPMRVRKKEIPKEGGTKVRILSIPSIRDRVVQGALKLIFNRDRTDTDRSERPMKRYAAWPRRSSWRRPASSTLICAPTLTAFSITCCSRR